MDNEGKWQELPLDSLLPLKGNPNRMDSRVITRLRNALEQFGFVQNLVVMPAKGKPGKYVIIAGNHRVEILKRMKSPPEKVMCCVVPPLSKAQRHLLAQALNRIHGTDDRDAVRELYESLISDVGAEAVNDTVGHLSMVQRLLAEEQQRLEEAASKAEAEPTQPQDEKPMAERLKPEPNTAYCADSLKVVFPKHCFDSIITDPPYQIGIFEKAWDSKENVYEFTLEWATRHLDSLKPGGFLGIFINTRQYDLVCRALREVGFIIRDPLIWIRYISKIPGRRLNEEGTVYTTLKYGAEFIVVAQKQPEGTFTENFKKHGVGGFFFENAILPFKDKKDEQETKKHGFSIIEAARAGRLGGRGYRSLHGSSVGWIPLKGRRPSNVVVLPEDGSLLPENYRPYFVIPTVRHGSKQSQGHETQKRVELWEWVVKLLTPPGGLSLDLFAGSGTHGEACLRCDRYYVMIEKSKRYYETLCKRMEKCHASSD